MGLYRMFDIIGYIYKQLENLGVSVQEGWYDENINDTHITYFCVNENETEFEDDVNTCEKYLIQVDIWSKEDVLELKEKVKIALKEADFTFKYARDFIETDTKIYHKVLRFEYVWRK